MQERFLYFWKKSSENNEPGTVRPLTAPGFFNASYIIRLSSRRSRKMIRFSNLEI